jgi:hypothetical protein
VTCIQVDKLQFVLYIKDIPTVEGRNAELALWRRSTDEAEKILVQVGGCVVVVVVVDVVAVAWVLMQLCHIFSSSGWIILPGHTNARAPVQLG